MKAVSVAEVVVVLAFVSEGVDRFVQRGDLPVLKLGQHRFQRGDTHLDNVVGRLLGRDALHPQAGRGAD